MKVYKKSLIVGLLFILIGIGFLGLSTSVRAISDINYTFIDNELYNEVNPSYHDTFNLENETYISEIYDATYSFTNEIDGTIGTDIDFVDSCDTAINTEIINNISNHNKVLKQSNIGSWDSCSNIFDMGIVSNGTIEFWIYVDNPTKQVFIPLSENTLFTIIIRLYIIDDYFKYEPRGSGQTIVPNAPIPQANTWYRIEIEWYSDSIYDLTIEGISCLDGVDTTAEFTKGINYFSCFTYDTFCYIDAIGYSWQPIYAFDDDIIGNEPIEWISDNGDGCTSIIIESFDDYSNVLELYDNANDGSVKIYKNISQEVDQTISFDVAKSSIAVDKLLTISFIEGSDYIFMLKLTENDLYSQQSPPPDDIIKENFIVANTFFQIKIVLNDSVDTFDCYINGVLEANDLDYLQASTISIDNIAFTTFDSYSQYYCYIDNIYLSSDLGYNIGDNINPLLITTNDLVVSKDEFGFNQNGVQYELGDIPDENYINGWEVSNPFNDDVSVIPSKELFDKEIELYSDTAHIRGLMNEYQITSDGTLNFTMVINYINMNNDGSYLYWGVYNTSTIEIALVRLYYTGGNIYMGVMNETRTGYDTLLILDDSEYLTRHFSLLINENDNINCTLRYFDNSSVDETYSFNRIGNSTYYKKAIVWSGMNDENGDQTFHIDSLGLKINSSINRVKDYGLYLIDLDCSKWNSQINNLFEIDANGTLGISTYSSTEFDTESIEGFYNYSGYKFYNIYDDPFLINNPFLSLITNESVSINSIKITGVKITDGTTIYYPDFYSGYVNIDESYFYVDSNNKLQFSLICNDNYTEYIELRIYLITKTTENRSISFQSNIDGVSQGYVHLGYWGYITTDIYFPYYQTTTTVYLPQGYIIYTLSIIISDEDTTWYDNCNGYITDLRFIHTPLGVPPLTIPDLDITLLIGVLIPLMIILAPTLAIGSRYGRKTILPIFIFMCLFCVMTNLIPIWLFFIIALGSGALMIGQRMSGDD